jgi:protein TonB
MSFEIVLMRPLKMCLFMVFICFLTKESYGQMPVEKPEVEALFAGGPEAFKSYVAWNWERMGSVTKGAPKGIYEIVVRFYVEKTGRISDVVALTKFGYGMEELAIRLIQKGPYWVPAKTGGRYVNSYHQQTITFTVK